MEFSYNGICPYCFSQKGYSTICPHCGYEEKTSAMSNHLHPRTLLQNRYLIGALIGVGGFGIVYKAFDLKLNRIIAIKELFPPSLVNRIAGEQEVIVTSQKNVSQFKYMLERFRTEAKNLSRLVNDGNVVGIYDCVTANNTAYIIMEYLEGQTLENRLNRQGKLEPVEAARIICAALDGLERVHACGIVHRDIKPGNIFLCKDGSVKIIDFGAARFMGFAEDPRMICSKVFTDGYAPPEQYRDDSEQGPYTDIYAAGATMYAMLTGQVPPPSPDIKDGSAKLYPPSRWEKSIPDSMDRAILRAMSMDPRIRFANTGDFRCALQGNNAVRTEGEELTARRRARGAAAAAVIIALCAALLGGVYYIMQLRDSDSAQAMLTGDESISVLVCTEGENVQELQALYDSLSGGFAGYAASVTDRTITVSVECVDEELVSGLPVTGSGEPADLICGGSGGSIFGEECTSDWLDALVGEGYKFSPADPNAFVTSFDADVLYVNLKLLEEAGLNISDLDNTESIESAGEITAIPKLYGSYEGLSVSPDALERFCNGESLFCAARASDIRTVSRKLPGYCSALPMPSGSISAAYADVWRINGAADENTQHAAELFLSYLVSDEAQDILCLQNDCGLPVNSDIYALYSSFHHELEKILSAEEQFVFEG